MVSQNGFDNHSHLSFRPSGRWQRAPHHLGFRSRKWVARFLSLPLEVSFWAGMTRPRHAHATAQKTQWRLLPQSTWHVNWLEVPENFWGSQRIFSIPNRPKTRVEVNESGCCRNSRGNRAKSTCSYPPPLAATQNSMTSTCFSMREHRETA